MTDRLYVEIDNLDIEWRKNSARGYDIDSLELEIRAGETNHYDCGQVYGRDYLKENLDEVIRTEARSKAARGWGVGLKAYRVVTVAWETGDGYGGLKGLGEDWKYNRYWEEEA